MLSIHDSQGGETPRGLTTHMDDDEEAPDLSFDELAEEDSNPLLPLNRRWLRVR